jgi:hypothetical protein
MPTLNLQPFRGLIASQDRRPHPAKPPRHRLQLHIPLRRQRLHVCCHSTPFHHRASATPVFAVAIVTPSACLSSSPLLASSSSSAPTLVNPPNITTKKPYHPPRSHPRLPSPPQVAHIQQQHEIRAQRRTAVTPPRAAIFTAVDPFILLPSDTTSMACGTGLLRTSPACALPPPQHTAHTYCNVFARYGSQLHIMRITLLSSTEYAEEPALQLLPQVSRAVIPRTRRALTPPFSRRFPARFCVGQQAAAPHGHYSVQRRRARAERGGKCHAAGEDGRWRRLCGAISCDYAAAAAADDGDDDADDVDGGDCCSSLCWP